MDREKVIKALEICEKKDCVLCPYTEWCGEYDDNYFYDCTKLLAKDVLALLKEQKMQKLFVDESGKINSLPIAFPNCPLKEQEEVKPIAKENDTFECVCGAIVGWEELDSSGIVTERFNYCPFCGKAVKWE